MCARNKVKNNVKNKAIWRKKFILSTFFLFGCGIKGPPLPPIAEKTVQEISASAEEKKAEKEIKKNQKKKNE